METLDINWNRIFPLVCGVQHYPWGGKPHGDRQPYIADLVGSHASPGQPWAELWIGAHPKLPSEVQIDGHRTAPLNELIERFPEAILGPKLINRGVTTLPFLLKVLDCERALSIQAHPDRPRAAALHAQDPQHYPDPNHKPEIAISLAGMDAFCQFRPHQHIQEDIRRLPPLTRFFAPIPNPPANQPAGWLRKAYAHVFNAPQGLVDDSLRALKAELEGGKHPRPQDKWFLEVAAVNPGDRGALSAYFLNVEHIAPGEAIFLGPNQPHAYLRGTIVECMANSDNVVRAGLTPKFVDREALLEMLAYSEGRPDILTGESVGHGEKCFNVPVPDFQVRMVQHTRASTERRENHGIVALWLVLKGHVDLKWDGCQGIRMRRGQAFLWPAALDTCKFNYPDEDVLLVDATVPVAI